MRHKGSGNRLFFCNFILASFGDFNLALCQKFIQDQLQIRPFFF